MAMNDYSDNDYWKALAERFFEAGTSEEEERELRRFIASGLAGSEFNDVRAVMGLAAVGARRYHRHDLPVGGSSGGGGGGGDDCGIAGRRRRQLLRGIHQRHKTHRRGDCHGSDAFHYG